jgi:hypothetical protein
MTSSPTQTPDRVYRSPAGIVGGAVLLALGAWLGIDAALRGDGSTPWLALAGLLFAIPLVAAFTLRPAVFGNEERLRIRNPFRVITLPWGTVATLRSGYSNEVFDEAGAKYQLWAIPVSLRARKRAQSKTARRAARGAAGKGVTAGTTGTNVTPGLDDLTLRAPSDQAMDDLKELCETHADRPEAQGTPEVHWSWEIIAPSAVGLVLLIVLALAG